MKPTVFLGATTLAPGNGGIGRVARMSASALLQDRYRVDMVTLLDKPPMKFQGQQVRACGGGKLAFAAHCHAAALGQKEFLYDSAGPARAHPRFPGLRRRYAVWIHGIEVWGVPVLRPDYVAAVRRADLVLVNSQYTLRRAEQNIGPLPQARVCWLATEQDEAAAPAMDDGPPTALILGRMDETESYKGHGELIAAWEQVISAVPAARLLIAGGGSGLAALRAQAAASPAAQNIDIPGFIAEAEIENLWQKASVFAMPSRGEGFGLVYIEAMRHGLPVIASAHDAGQEVNVDGQTGFNVSLDRQGELAARLIMLLGDADLRRRMGAAGQKHWREHFRFTVFKDRFLPLMKGRSQNHELV